MLLLLGLQQSRLFLLSVVFLQIVFFFTLYAVYIVVIYEANFN